MNEQAMNGMEDEMHDDIERPEDGLLERVRALADGTLSSEEADRLLVEAAASPEDRALMEAFREVHALTAVADEDVPACSVTFADVEARIARDETSVTPLFGRVFRHTGWRVAAAAVLVAGIGVAASQWASTPSSSENAGGQIVAAATVVQMPAFVSPEPAAAGGPGLAAVDAAAATLANFVPFEDGEPQWLTSLDEGRAVSQVMGRPVLLFIHHPTCPMCLDLKSQVFSDAEVQARLQEFVPVMVDVMTLPKELQPFLQKGWPYLGALDADGKEFAVLPNRTSKPSSFRDQLDEALATFGVEDQAAWGPARALAARWVEASNAFEVDEFGPAWTEYEALRSDDTDGPFGRAATARLADIGGVAADAIEEAELSAETAPERAALQLATIAAVLEGTPYQAPLEAVAEALREDGRLPQLQFTPGGVR